jgi:hypothetical protein
MEFLSFLFAFIFQLKMNSCWLEQPASMLPSTGTNRRYANRSIDVVVEGVLDGRCDFDAPQQKKSLCFSLECNNGTEQLKAALLIRQVSQHSRLHSSDFFLTLNGRPLQPDSEISLADWDAQDWLVLRLFPRNALLGGKGGFGSLLRTATTKVGSKKTSNFSASRDLQGRRLRHVEAEQKIAEWNSQHHEPVKPAGQTKTKIKIQKIEKQKKSMDNDDVRLLHCGSVRLISSVVAIVHAACG